MYTFPMNKCDFLPPWTSEMISSNVIPVMDMHKCVDVFVTNFSSVFFDF